MAFEVGQAKTRRTDLNKFTLDLVRGGKFVYKSVEHVTNTTLIATVFFLLLIFGSLIHEGPLTLYSSLWTILILHLLII